MKNGDKEQAKHRVLEKSRGRKTCRSVEIVNLVYKSK